MAFFSVLVGRVVPIVYGDLNRATRPASLELRKGSARQALTANKATGTDPTPKRPGSEGRVRTGHVCKRVLHEITEMAEKKKRLNTKIEEALDRTIKMRAVEEVHSISNITRDL